MRGGVADRAGDPRVDLGGRTNQDPAAGEQHVGRELGRSVAVAQQSEPAVAHLVATPGTIGTERGRGREQLVQSVDAHQSRRG